MITRLACWVGLIGAVAALNYAAYGKTSGGATRDEIYSWSAFADGTIFYAVVLGLVLLIAIDRFDLLALRVPRAFGRAAGMGLSVIVAIIVWEYVVTALPIEDPGKEQGLTPTHWEPAHAGAFAANVVLFVAIAPFVEEIAFRGVGQSLWRGAVGAGPAVVVVGLFFGIWHGLLVALLVLVPFGWGLSYLRERTGSVVPGMLVHALFNGAAIAASVLS
ncbi:MAG TPA: type II CAAX endopeptidase family protein [Gaiellaceae bacterium]|nr:type II CAAX endopeptidase family protein [Gaiellaceae bacterium]